MAEKTTAIAKRNTAIKTNSLVEMPCLEMLREEVSVGTKIWSFDPTNPANEALVFKGDEPGTREWTQHVSEPFCLVSWMVQRIEMPNETTGEEQPALRVVLYDEEDETMTFVSVGIAASLDTIRTLRGDGPYSPTIPLVVVPVRTRKGFNTLRLRPVTEVPAKKTKGS